MTARAVEAAKPREKGYKLADGHGLYLFVTPAGGKSWRANYMLAGKQKTRTYGRWPEM
ncbi:MAG TPA: Arm DNA-binding domain-containing protein, partial [Variovorax sp.]